MRFSPGILTSTVSFPYGRVTATSAMLFHLHDDECDNGPVGGRAVSRLKSSADKLHLRGLSTTGGLDHHPASSRNL